MKKWYVVLSQAHSENKAEHHLQRQGFETYLPRFSKRRRHARKIESVLAPLFPRYLFVRIDMDVSPWRAVRSTVGVRDLISLGEWPTPVDDSIIEVIRNRENETGAVQLNYHTRWERGQKVRVAIGPMADVEGLFECIDDKHRVVVLLSLMGREVRTHLPAEALEAAA